MGGIKCGDVGEEGFYELRGWSFRFSFGGESGLLLWVVVSSFAITREAAANVFDVVRVAKASPFDAARVAVASSRFVRAVAVTGAVTVIVMVVGAAAMLMIKVRESSITTEPFFFEISMHFRFYSAGW